MIYDSITKQPVDLAVVRIFTTEGKLVTTKVTDTYGRYNFIVGPGSYKIWVQKENYEFPSRTLKDKREDARYNLLYFGKEIVIKNGSTMINYNIPIDIDPKHRSTSALVLSSVLHQTQKYIALLGPLLSLMVLFITPTLLFAGLFILHLIVYLIFRRIMHTASVKTYGYILDAATQKPIKRAVVKLFDTEYNKLLDTHVTDRQGQYNFLVGGNDYFLTVEKNGYETYRSATLHVANGEEGIISPEVRMFEAI